MTDREKVLQGWERCKICDTSFFATDDARKAYVECEYTTGLYCRRDKLINETIALLKEHEEVVRCKDCKHRPKEPNLEQFESGWDIEFPEGSKCPCQCSGDSYYAWYPEDDWFCANCERKNI